MQRLTHLEYEKKKALQINCTELLVPYYSLGSFKTYFQNKRQNIFRYPGRRTNYNKMESTKCLVCNNIVKKF